MSFSLTEEEFKKFKKFIYERSGIYFSDVNRAILENRLYEVMLKNKFNNVMEYYDLLQKDSKEERKFLDLITTNLTRFFRNKAQFDALKNIVLPELMEKNSISKSIKIWSAGCASGEEPYSIAIIVAEVFGFNNGWNIKITGSDISLKSLLIAKEGYYPEERVKDVPREYLNKYFIKVSKGYKIIENIKEWVKFDYHNLRHEAAFSDLDIIFCRNVIIYFDKKAQIEVIQKFYRYLKKGGYLFLGHSESLFGMNTNFKFKKVGDAIVYYKE